MLKPWLLGILFGSVSLFCGADSLDEQLGEKLFRESRFSEHFFRNSHGNVNQPLVQGDPVLEKIQTDLGLFDHPYRGQQMSCAACHLVDQVASISLHKTLTYNDFAPRTPIPNRGDHQVTSLRHTSNLVGSFVREGTPLHWDGEFFAGKDLACASLTGRNMGWLLSEAGLARSHIVRVMREDNGDWPTDVDLTISYAEAFSSLGLNIAEMSDQELFDKSCEYIDIYMKSLDFSRDEKGHHNGSGYDLFLEQNGLDRAPKSNQSSLDYVDQIRKALMDDREWSWVAPEPLSYHEHPRQFGDLELEGMKIFFGKGKCTSCHVPPDFTDFGFHNTGISQMGYDKIHGYKSFSQLSISSWRDRVKNPHLNFIATESHPEWQGPYRQIPSLMNPQWVDLGVWNIFGHPDKAQTQSNLKQTICRSLHLPDCLSRSEESILPHTVGLFKTPTLRSLGQSAPYFSDGSAASIDEALQVYMLIAQMAKRDLIVNGDPELKGLQLRHYDFAALKAFLQSLDEDYD